MRRIVIIAAVLAFCAVLAGTASSADAAPEAPAKAAHTQTVTAPTHTQSVAQAHCDWHEVLHYGPNPNGVVFLDCKPMHVTGLGSGHHAHAIVCDTFGGNGAKVLMDIGTGGWGPYQAVYGCLN